MTWRAVSARPELKEAKAGSSGKSGKKGKKGTASEKSEKSEKRKGSSSAPLQDTPYGPVVYPPKRKPTKP
jgi:hypothetical protein